MQGRRVYILGTAPNSYSSACHLTSGLAYLRPGAILLDTDPSEIGPSKAHPHCKAAVSRKVSSLLASGNDNVTAEQVVLRNWDGLWNVDWLLTVGYFVTQLPEAHLLVARPPARALTEQAIRSYGP